MQRYNPPSEWVIVEKAHQALITEEDAMRIIEIRKGRTCPKFTRTSNRTHSSNYLLSGGKFICQRCGGNLVGFQKNAAHKYYVCNSVPNRRGLGCGPGVYVPQEEIEREVFSGLKSLMGVCTDKRGFVRKVNAELRRIWEDANGYNPTAAKRVSEIETKIGNIRKAIEEGLTDTSWANERLMALETEKESLFAATSAVGEPPYIDIEAAMAYRRNIDKVFSVADQAEKKRVLAAWVDKVELTPETLEVEIQYKIPEPVVDSMGAGVGFEPTTFGL